MEDQRVFKGYRMTKSALSKLNTMYIGYREMGCNESFTDIVVASVDHYYESIFLPKQLDSMKKKEIKAIKKETVE